MNSRYQNHPSTIRIPKLRNKRSVERASPPCSKIVSVISSSKRLGAKPNDQSASLMMGTSLRLLICAGEMLIATRMSSGQ